MHITALEEIEKMIAYDKEKGNPEVYQLPEAERGRWHKAISHIYDEWIA